jgi:hypothetical protein
MCGIKQDDWLAAGTFFSVPDLGEVLQVVLNQTDD